MPQHGPNGDNMSRRPMPQHGSDEVYPFRWLLPQHGFNGDNTSHRLMLQHGPDGVYLPRWSMPQHGPSGGSFAMSWKQRLHDQGMFRWRSTHIGMPFVESCYYDEAAVQSTEVSQARRYVIHCPCGRVTLEPGTNKSSHVLPLYTCERISCKLVLMRFNSVSLITCTDGCHV